MPPCWPPCPPCPPCPGFCWPGLPCPPCCGLPCCCCLRGSCCSFAMSTCSMSFGSPPYDKTITLEAWRGSYRRCSDFRQRIGKSQENAAQTIGKKAVPQFPDTRSAPRRRRFAARDQPVKTSTGIRKARTHGIFRPAAHQRHHARFHLWPDRDRLYDG